MMKSIQPRMFWMPERTREINFNLGAMPFPKLDVREWPYGPAARPSDAGTCPVQRRDAGPQSVPSRGTSMVVRPFLRLVSEECEAHLALQEKVQQALSASGHLALRAIRVSVEFDEVCLIGTVPTYYLKQLAQALVLAIGEVHALRDELEVL